LKYILNLFPDDDDLLTETKSPSLISLLSLKILKSAVGRESSSNSQLKSLFNIADAGSIGFRNKGATKI
jgi:hypothetical protein